MTYEYQRHERRPCRHSYRVEYRPTGPVLVCRCGKERK